MPYETHHYTCGAKRNVNTGIRVARGLTEKIIGRMRALFFFYLLPPPPKLAPAASKKWPNLAQIAEGERHPAAHMCRKKTFAAHRHLGVIILQCESIMRWPDIISSDAVGAGRGAVRLAARMWVQRWQRFLTNGTLMRFDEPSNNRYMCQRWCIGTLL